VQVCCDKALTLWNECKEDERAFLLALAAYVTSIFGKGSETSQCLDHYKNQVESKGRRLDVCADLQCGLGVPRAMLLKGIFDWLYIIRHIRFKVPPQKKHHCSFWCGGIDDGLVCGR
jgi:hypothetical protein